MKPETIYDTIVVGLGAMGSSTVRQLAARGARVLGLERWTPPHDLGSSHGGSRIIRQAYFEHPSYVPLVLRAYEAWRRLERDSGRQLLQITGGLVLDEGGAGIVDGSAGSAREHGLQYELLDGAELRRRFPQFAPSPRTRAVYEPTAGVVRPEAAIVATLECATRDGATLHFGERALRWEARPSGEGVTVLTERALYAARSLVLTTGPWARELLDELDLPLRVERQVQFWFRPRAAPEQFDYTRCPVWIWEDEHGVLYGCPALDGAAGGAKVGVHHGGADCTPDTIDRVVHPGEVAALRSRLRVRLPSLGGSLVDAKTCMYTNSPDGHFVIGLHPRLEQVALAVGFSGHGFKFAPVVGEALADLVSGGSTPLPLDLFDPRRRVLSGRRN